MGLRTFRDSKGTEWKVWDVPPRFRPLRSETERRGSAMTGVPRERRTGVERRVTTPPPEWVHGWICFQSADKKLRLCPMPKNWQTADNEELEHLREKAVPVRFTS